MKPNDETLSNSQATNYPALYTLVTVFFFWGFFAAGNSLFIPFCKHFFHLDQFQSQLIDFAFYTAYYLGSLLLFLYSSFKGYEIVLHWGLKKTIVWGLLMSALGAGVMIWAVQLSVYAMLLIGLFVVALGFSLQQIAANPLAILLGNPKTGASRVNLGGGINSLGATLGPLLVAFVLFGSTKSISDEQIQHLSLTKMSVLYGAVGLLFLLAMLLFRYSKKVPAGVTQAPMEKPVHAIRVLLVMTLLLAIAFTFVFQTYSGTSGSGVLTADPYLEWKRVGGLLLGLLGVLGCLFYALFKSSKNPKGWGAMQYPQLVLGMLAILMYTGAEVGIGSNLGELLKLDSFGGMHSSEIAPYVSMYWGSLMIGRWAGAVSVFSLSRVWKTIALIGVPFIAYMVIMIANQLAGNEIQPLYYYSLCVGLQVVFSFLSQDKAARTLWIFSAFGIGAMLVGLFSNGMLAIYAFLAGGLACSIMWPAIFNLAIMGLGKYTAQGSSFLIMMILGAGILPPLQGKVADIMGIQQSYFVVLLCFVYLLLFALVAKRILMKQNIDIDTLD